MYVINKKRFSLIIICVLLAIFTYAYEDSKMNLEEDKMEVTATPVSGKVVVVDARTWSTR